MLSSRDVRKIRNLVEKDPPGKALASLLFAGLACGVVVFYCLFSAVFRLGGLACPLVMGGGGLAVVGIYTLRERVNRRYYLVNGVELWYDLSPKAEARYERLLGALDEIARDLLPSYRNRLACELPDHVRCNLDVYAARSGKVRLFFFPDAVLPVDTGVREVAVIGYRDVSAWQTTETVTKWGHYNGEYVVSNSWQHSRVDGGPDRRFKSNSPMTTFAYPALTIDAGEDFVRLAGYSEDVMKEAKEALAAWRTKAIDLYGS